MRTLVLILSLILVVPAHTATPPHGYVEMTAVDKRAWHQKAGQDTPYWLHPGTVRTACGQGVALLGFVSTRYLKQPFESGSGYADSFWRWLTGKAIHRHGPMAPGEVTLETSILGLPVGTHPVTMRYSLANVFIRGVSAGNFRPGLVVIFHRDGQEDVSLFVMPRNGLDGFATEQNPFSLNYTNALALPSESVQAIARRTFGRAVTDVFNQRIEGATAVELTPHEGWAPLYDATRRGFFHDRLAAIPAPESAKPLFDLLTYDGSDTGARTRIGVVSLTGAWVVSKHADRWYVHHNGFTVRP